MLLFSVNSRVFYVLKLAVAMGVLFILRGLGLGIPYVSPSDMSLFVQATPDCH